MLWSLGVGATQSLFDAGYTRAAVDTAQAAYAQAAANYRQAVLVAFQDVQDSLSSQAALQAEAKSLEQASRSAAQAQSLAEKLYHGGATSQQDYLLAQQSRLDYQRLLVQNQGQQLLNSVQLIKALGGGWQPQAAEPAHAPQ